MTEQAIQHPMPVTAAAAPKGSRGWRTVRVIARRLAVGLLAGAATGVVAGLAARLMMRLAALAVGAESHFSLEGTGFIVFVFVTAALPGAVLAAMLPGRRGRSALLVLLALLLCVPATATAGADLQAAGTLTTLEWVLVCVPIGGIYVAVLGMPWLALRLLRLGTRTDRRARTW
jgi:hypothetical protein